MGQVSGKLFGDTDGLDPAGKQLPQNANADQLGINGAQLFARHLLKGGLQGLGQMGQQPQPQGQQPNPFIQNMNRNPFYGQ